jgi:hypothetical protein
MKTIIPVPGPSETHRGGGDLDDLTYVTLRLAEVGVWGGLRHLDLPRMTRPVRSFLYNYLGKFPRLKWLDLGNGTGGWLTEGFLNRCTIA